MTDTAELWNSGVTCSGISDAPLHDQGAVIRLSHSLRLCAVTVCWIQLETPIRAQVRVRRRSKCDRQTSVFDAMDPCFLSSFRYHPAVDGDTPGALRSLRGPMKNQIQLYYSSFDTTAGYVTESVITCRDVSLWLLSTSVNLLSNIHPDVWRTEWLSPRGSSSISERWHWERRRRGKEIGQKRKRPAWMGRKWRSLAWTPMSWFATTGARCWLDSQSGCLWVWEPTSALSLLS